MTAAPPNMKTRTLAGWFGGNRLLAESVGVQLGKLEWCGVPFCGGCPELPYIRTRAGVASDLHRHIINLARCITSQETFEQLLSLVDSKLFHPDDMAAAKTRCKIREETTSLFFEVAPTASTLSSPDPEWGADYFAATWMGRGGHAGKKTEFGQSLATRWTAGGGDSAIRYRSAVDSLIAWREVLKRWSFETRDVFDFLDRVKDEPGIGIYCDAPWPDAGHEYKHDFDDHKQERLAARLLAFKHARIVIRFGDHPLIQHLYPESRWTWMRQTSRSQANSDVDETLIVNGQLIKEAVA